VRKGGESPPHFKGGIDISLKNYCEEFILYRRETAANGAVSGWKEAERFVAAITSGKHTELRESSGPGVGQIVGIKEKYILYTLLDSCAVMLPVLDDFIKRLKDGESYRIVSDPKSRVTPNRAMNRYCVCEIVKYELPQSGGNDE